MRLLPTLLALLVLGCASAPALPSPPLEVPPEAYRFKPYPIYWTWLREVNECAGTDGRVEDIEFWAVPSRGFGLYGGSRFAGYFDKRADPDRMYLVEHDRENEGLVKHEFLHQQADTLGTHPTPPYWLCAPIDYVDAPWRRE